MSVPNYDEAARMLSKEWTDAQREAAWERGEIDCGRNRFRSVEMSEDPVKDEPLSSGEFDTAEQAAARVKHFESTARNKAMQSIDVRAQQIRIEALRAAAMVSQGDTGSEYVLTRAKQFAAFLESGE